MSTLDLKKQVMEKLLHADDNLLQKVKSSIEDYEEERLKVHTVSGKRLNKQQYRQEIFSAEKEIEEGNAFTTEELVKILQR